MEWLLSELEAEYPEARRVYSENYLKTVLDVPGRSSEKALQKMLQGLKVSAATL